MFNCVGVQKPLVEYALVELFCSIVVVQYILVQASWKDLIDPIKKPLLRHELFFEAPTHI